MKIIGCGNADRGDDAAGVLVARRLRAWGLDAREATSLFDAWEPGDDVIIVDAMMSGRETGAIATWDGDHVPSELNFRGSSHGLGVTEAIRLAKALDRSPARLRIYAIEGKQFAVGSDVSPEVAKAIETVSAEIARAAGIARLRM